jgi:hypothetical protein
MYLVSLQIEQAGGALAKHRCLCTMKFGPLHTNHRWQYLRVSDVSVINHFNH